MSGLRVTPSVILLSARQWLEQSLPYNVGDFGAPPGRRDTSKAVQYVFHWEDVSHAVDVFVAEFKDPTPCLPPLNMSFTNFTANGEGVAQVAFNTVLYMVGSSFGMDLVIDVNAAMSSSVHLGPGAGADQLAASLAAATTRPDMVVNHNGRPIMVVEMKKPAIFRRNVHSAIPNLGLLGSLGPEASNVDVVRLESLQQLVGYIVAMNLEFGILSSFDLTYVVQRIGEQRDTLLVFEGISSTSPRFLGLILFILHKANTTCPKDFKRPDPKVISPTIARGSLKSQGSKGDNKGKEKEESGKWQLGGMSQGPCDGLPETPAELLHLERHHLAIGWSGRIVRGTYEGQSIVVKLAPIGSVRAEALLTEVAAYHMLKEFWGKYVPHLVSYGTTVGGTIMYIATEEVRGYEIGTGPLYQEVVEEIFDALAVVHQCGILHGDIRPSNILVARGQQAGVRFLDFGFACFDTSDEGRKREYAQLVSLVSVFTC